MIIFVKCKITTLCHDFLCKNATIICKKPTCLCKNATKISSLYVFIMKFINFAQISELKMKRLFFSVLSVVLLSFPFITYAATLVQVDSLLSVYDDSRSDYLSAGREIVDFVSGDAMFFAGRPVLSESMSRSEVDMNVLFAVERWMTTCSYFAEALPVIERVISLSVRMNEQDIELTALCDRAYCLYKTSDYPASIEAGQQAAKLGRETNNKVQLSRAYLYMALVNYAVRDYEEAPKLLELAISTNAESGSDEQTHNILGIACELYCGAGQIDKAIECGLEAVESARKLGYRPAIANHLTQLSYAYDRAGEYQLGLAAAEEAIEIVESIEPLDRNQLAISLEFKGWNLIDMHHYKEAVVALRRAIELEEELGNRQAVCYDYRTLYEALEPIDAREALAALKRYTVMKDSLHSQQLKDLMTKANAELYNDELQEENQAGRRKLRNAMWLSVGIVLLFTIILISFWYAFREKRRTADALKRLTEAREGFFTNVTHEFRTPLTVILGVGNELRSKVLDEEEQHESGAMIVRQGERLLTLVNQMLDISKVKSAIGEQPQRQGNLAAYISMLVESHREVARLRNITIYYSAEPNSIETAFVADYVDKAVGNLLDNAVKFTRDGGHVDVSMRLTDGMIELKVSDTGCGISEADLPHIFEPFYRAANSDTVGSGIGLALVKQIVDSSGGTIDVKSSPGQGTTFVIKLPQTFSSAHYDAAEWMRTGDSKDPGSEPSDTENDLQSDVNDAPTILVVEDNPDVSRYIGSLLSDTYKLYYAADGRRGLAMAQDLLPDIIITDLMMPYVDGLQLCHGIRENINTDHIPVIVVTAKATQEDRLRGLKAGADAYLTKPFNADELLISIQNILQQRSRLKKRFAVVSAPDDAEVVEPVDSVIGQDAAGTSSTLSAVAFMEKIDDIVNRLIPNNCTVEMLAKEMYMSQRTLQRKMISISGVTPKKYIMDARFKLACKMLGDYPDRTIEDIATACGFHDASHFIHAYQSVYGVSPRKRDSV